MSKKFQKIQKFVNIWQKIDFKFRQQLSKNLSKIRQNSDFAENTFSLLYCGNTVFSSKRVKKPGVVHCSSSLNTIELEEITFFSRISYFLRRKRRKNVEFVVKKTKKQQKNRSMSAVIFTFSVFFFSLFFDLQNVDFSARIPKGKNRFFYFAFYGRLARIPN